MRKYKRETTYLRRAVQWKGDNIEEVKKIAGLDFHGSTSDEVFIFVGRQIKAVKIGEYIIKEKIFLSILTEEEYNKQYKEIFNE